MAGFIGSSGKSINVDPTIKILKNYEPLPQPLYFPRAGVIVTGACRDVEPYLPMILKNIGKITSSYSRAHVVIFESGSKDNTLSILKGWALNKAVTILTTDFVDDKRRREERLADARNHIFQHMKNSKMLHNFDYWINMDLDDILSYHSISLPSLVTSFEYKHWDVVCANTWPTWYYDKLALRTSIGPVNSTGCSNKQDCHENRPINLKSWFGQKVDGRGIDPEKVKDFLEVDSCFSGLAVYKTEKLKDSTCTYDGRYDCEHVSFHTCIKKLHGAKIFINPLFVPFDLVEEKVPHSVLWAKQQKD